MKTRIGLVTTKAMGRSSTSFVEVEGLKELSAELTKIGAKRVALFWRDRIGDGHVEGEPFAVADLKDTHFTWVSTHPKDGMRGLFCDTK